MVSNCITETMNSLISFLIFLGTLAVVRILDSQMVIEAVNYQSIPRLQESVQKMFNIDKYLLTGGARLMCP